MSRPVFYDCQNCPSYCCTYPRIAVTKRDVERLAKHFDISYEKARARFTKQGATKRERVLRHKEDEVFGSACRFLDRETRLCTIHKARPEVCRKHPVSPSCAYYNFLMSERRDQEDPDMIVRAYNLPEDWRKLG